jgi:predicted Rossmann fold flavoprotein
MSNFDVIVIGAGASGMMAAGRAGERGRRVLLLEKNTVVGKKLSITGGGRCNIFNAETDTRKLLSFYGQANKFLFSPFSQFGTKVSWDFFEQKGMPIVVEANLRAFPESQSAKDVTALMLRYVKENKVTLKLGVSVTGFVIKNKALVGVKTTAGEFYAENMVIATGGMAHSETGSTGEGLAWLKELGHTVHKPNPNLVPLKTKDKWVKDLSGTSLTTKITFIDAKETKNTKFSAKGKLLFTHFGISGPVVLNASHIVKDMLEQGEVIALIDLKPDVALDMLETQVITLFDQHKNKNLATALKYVVPEGTTKAFSALLPTSLLETKVHSVTKAQRQKLVSLIKALPLTITNTMGYENAVVSDGGVDLREVDTKTMCSKIYPNLYLTGDVLHINRPSGGYSLQLCWTTGWVAGSNA